MKSHSVILLLMFVSALLAEASAAQSAKRFNFGAGMGFTEPAYRAGNSLNTGWDLDFRGGYNVSRHLALDVDFSYNHWNLNAAALAQYEQPGGYTSIWSLSLAPVYRLFPRRRTDVYAFGGPGLYYRNLSLTQPAVVFTILCDPFFGYCYPTAIGFNEVVESFTTYKGGFNVGSGLEHRLGNGGWKVFGEARYSRMFTTNGSDLIYVPVTFGFRW